MPLCHQCGQDFEIDEEGVATHVNENGDVDYDTDADHVPYKLDDDDSDSDFEKDLLPNVE